MPGKPLSETAVIAPIAYVKRPPAGEKLETYAYQLPEGVTQPSNVETEEHDMVVTDVRSIPEGFSLQRNGFTLAPFKVPDDIDWQNDTEVKRLYYPALERLLKEQTGATRVHIFDHTLRNGKAQSSKGVLDKGVKKPIGEGQPVVRAHVDYTAKSGIERLHVLLPDEAEKLQQTPYAVIQVWRPLAGPVDDSPLAMADASTVDFGDLIPNTLHFPGRTGEVYGVAHNPAHKWYYAKGIDTNEAYVFVCFDSRTDRARFTPHTGFVDPNTKPDAPARRSVESRIYVFWENDQPEQQ